MSSKARHISWTSYAAFVLSILPVPLFFALIYNIQWTGFTTMPLIFTIMVIAFILSLIGIFKKAENKIVSVIALIITMGSGLFTGLIVIVSGMVQT